MRSSSTDFKLLRVFFIALFLSAGFSSAWAAEDGTPGLKNAPDGFAGLKWGDPPDKLGDEAIMFNEGKPGGLEAYVMPGESLAWDDFRINEAVFSFKNNKLILVRITFLNSTDVKKLTDYAMEKYEAPSLTKNRNGGVAYVWDDEETGVTLQIYPDKLPELGLINHRLAMLP
jgi:hypothetical protein